MSDYYRDLYRRPDGSVGWVETTLPKMHVRAFCDESSGKVWSVYRHQHEDLAYLVRPDGTERQMSGKVKGNYPAVIFHDGPIIYVQQDEGAGETSLDRVYHTGHVLTSELNGPYAAEGLAEVLPDGTVVLMNDPSRFRTIVEDGDNLWHNCVETPRYIVGQFGRDPDYGGSLSMLDKRTGEVKRWLGYTNQPPFAMEDASGKLWVAISGKDTPAPDQVVWSDAFPDLPERPAPQLPEMSFPQTVRPIFRGCLGWDGGPGNFAGGRKHNGRLIVEGTGKEKDGTPWILPADESRLLAVFTSPHESPAPLSDRAAAIDYAKRTGAVVLVYADRARWDLDEEDAHLVFKGVHSIPCIRVYPIGPHDTAEAAIDRLHADLRDLNSRWFAVTRPIYAQEVWSEEETARLNMLLTEVIESEPRIVMDIAFGWKRPQGSTQFKAWAETYFAGLCDRTPEPARDTLPRTVVNKPEPQPAPLEPKTPPPAPQPAKPVKESAWQKILRVKREKAQLEKLSRDERITKIIEALFGRKAS